MKSRCGEKSSLLSAVERLLQRWLVKFFGDELAQFFFLWMTELLPPFLLAIITNFLLFRLFAPFVTCIYIDYKIDTYSWKVYFDKIKQIIKFFGRYAKRNTRWKVYQKSLLLLKLFWISKCFFTILLRYIHYFSKIYLVLCWFSMFKRAIGVILFFNGIYVFTTRSYYTLLGIHCQSETIY